ncbi:MAG: DUF655 domain-containing protein [Desulfurococcales archaeon]|nr:DUF655 domain-containing protein [Desulfurococcales archaeon]
MEKFRGPRRFEKHEQPHIAALEVEAVVLDVIHGGYYADPHREHRNTTVAQAIGVRRFTLLDGIPLEPVEILERVTLARQVDRIVVMEQERLRRVKKLEVTLGCLPSGEKRLACYPVSQLEEDAFNTLMEEVKQEGRFDLVNSLDELKKIARDKGLPEKLLVVPRLPISLDTLTDIARNNLHEAVRKIIVSNEPFYVEFFNIAEPINIRQHSLELIRGIGKKTVKQLVAERSRRPFTSFEEVKKVIKVDPLEGLVEKIVEEITGESKYNLFIPPQDPGIPFFDYLSKMKKRAARAGGRYQ